MKGLLITFEWIVWGVVTVGYDYLDCLEVVAGGFTLNDGGRCLRGITDLDS